MNEAILSIKKLEPKDGDIVVVRISKDYHFSSLQPAMERLEEFCSKRGIEVVLLGVPEEAKIGVGVMNVEAFDWDITSAEIALDTMKASIPILEANIAKAKAKKAGMVLEAEHGPITISKTVSPDDALKIMEEDSAEESS